MDDHAWGRPHCGSNWTGYQCRQCGDSCPSHVTTIAKDQSRVGG